MRIIIASEIVINVNKMPHEQRLEPTTSHLQCECSATEPLPYILGRRVSLQSDMMMNLIKLLITRKNLQHESITPIE